ncbi:tail fiber protein [Pragia fontium]|uniref:tail fiber protein n=1 Tax=Pragia fontium TaxID=82985 RepID=UPI000F6E78A9|nr:tail fiber protein [Pragia fontium]VEJ54302.1 Phage tail fibre repeat [Pragia fontium]
MALTNEQELTLLALLNEKKITLSELPAATDLVADDLMLIRQGIIDKSVNSSVLKKHFTPPASSLTGAGIVKLSNAINSNDELMAATPKAVRQALELAITRSIDAVYPVGVVMFFAENKDPNMLFQGTKWEYLGEERTIRLAKKDASDLKELGGADMATLSVENMPAHTHSFSGSTSNFDYGTKTVSTFDYGTKTTNAAGEHIHDTAVGGNGSYTPFTNHRREAGISIRGADYTYNLMTAYTSSGGNHAHVVGIGAHNHTVGIGSHSHSINGNTNSVGSGSPVPVVNAYIKLMGWYRSA